GFPRVSCLYRMVHLTRVRWSNTLNYRFYCHGGLGMKPRLQLERSRLLGFRLSQGACEPASNDVRLDAEIGKSGETAPRTAAQVRAYFDACMGAKIGKTPV